MKTKEKVTGEFALIFVSYNLRRAMSILGGQELIKRLQALFYGYLQFTTMVMAYITKLFFNGYEQSSNMRLAL